MVKLLTGFYLCTGVYAITLEDSKPHHVNNPAYSRQANEPVTWSYGTFTYQQMTTDRYPTPLPSPLNFRTPYAPHFTQASSLLPTNITYTTYSLNASATATPDGQYGQSAYAALWANYSYTHQPPFTTTASPTPIASSELVYPPQLPARPLNQNENFKFGPDFIWGVSASAWQVEGGLQVEGRGPGLLDSTGVNGTGNLGTNDSNVADMHYFLYKQDIARLAALGVPYFSFSISWSRIVPFGIVGSPVNQQALDHYDDVINTCLEYGITPIVTLMHIDNPIGVFDDFDAFPTHFLYYAKQVMARYADRVPYWVTFNEPNIAVQFFLDSWDGLTAFMLAHSQVYYWYKDMLRGTGKLTMKFANNLAVPLDPSNRNDVMAAYRYQDFILGTMGNPLFLGRQFPENVLQTPNITLKPLTNKQIEFINGTMDYWAFDPYGPQYATEPPGGYEACTRNRTDPLWPLCVQVSTTQANGWKMGAVSEGGAVIAPTYVREQLGYVWNTFKPKGGIMITEFGFPQYADAETPVEAQKYDFQRTMYYQNFLTETLRAINLDRVNVIGALAWSWIDNNEFGTFEHQYGMMGVNRSDPKLTRWVKRSFFDYIDFFKSHT